MGLFLGIDTSCYTTSVACVDEKGIVYEKRTVLSVKLGQRGLRQSEGLFQHVRNLESLLPGMLACLDRSQIRGIGVSSRPRPEADSYMPVFLAGRMAAASLGAGLGLTPYHTSHQQGHVRAAMLRNEALLEQLPILGMHISGGHYGDFYCGRGIIHSPIGGYGGSACRPTGGSAGGGDGAALPGRRPFGSGRTGSGRHQHQAAGQRKGAAVFLLRGGNGSPLFAGQGQMGELALGRYTIAWPEPLQSLSCRRRIRRGETVSCWQAAWPPAGCCGKCCKNGWKRPTSIYILAIRP